MSDRFPPNRSAVPPMIIRPKMLAAPIVESTCAARIASNPRSRAWGATWIITTIRQKNTRNWPMQRIQKFGVRMACRSENPTSDLGDVASSGCSSAAGGCRVRNWAMAVKTKVEIAPNTRQAVRQSQIVSSIVSNIGTTNCPAPAPAFTMPDIKLLLLVNQRAIVDNVTMS